MHINFFLKGDRVNRLKHHFNCSSFLNIFSDRYRFRRSQEDQEECYPDTNPKARPFVPLPVTLPLDSIKASSIFKNNLVAADQCNITVGENCPRLSKTYLRPSRFRRSIIQCPFNRPNHHPCNTFCFQTLLEKT